MTNGQYKNDKENQGASDKSASATQMPTENAAYVPMTGLTRQTYGEEAGGSIQETGKNLLNQVKDTASQAYETATEKAATKLEEQKTNLSSGLTSVAGSVRQIGESLQGSEPPQGIAKLTAEYSGTAAQKIEQAANYFENNDLSAMYRDVESFARRNPVILIGGTFVIGLLAARFLKSSKPKVYTTAAGQNFASVESKGNGPATGEHERASAF